MNEAYWTVIENLAQSKDGELSIKAQKFEQFIKMSAEQRKQKIQLSVKEYKRNWKITPIIGAFSTESIF